jgi:16S rRNA (cytosine967-C5)-methyltransferase
MDVAPTSVPLARLLELSADAVLAVRGGRSLTDVLARTAADARPGVQALTFRALRQLGAASEVRRALAPKPPAPWVDALLCLSLALLWPAERPPYAEHTLVDQAVRAARQRAGAAAGFVNAVLRRFLRERETQVAAALRSPVAAYNHPSWWIEQLQRDWPGHWQALLNAANQHPPMTLRVNRRVCSGADYVQRLGAAGQHAVLLHDAPSADQAYAGQAVQLAQPCPVSQLPGFAEGHVSVQDAAAQRAGPLLLAGGDLREGARVLDACAAPGGKAAQLLELTSLELLALDVDATRLVKVRDTLQRLHLHAQVRVGDALEPARWWDGKPFDAVLLDAPCSASGIVRRHPDIRWLRRPADITALGALQARLLDTLWPLLAPGGRLLYATCSVFKCEGEQRIDAFLQRHGAASAALHPASPGHLLTVPDNPDEAGGAAPHDGFYYALIQKT